MAFKLDDFLSKKKEPTQVLDLSKVKITSKEELKRYLDKVPEFKIKVERVPADGVKIKDKDFSFVAGKREEKQTKEWSFPDPTPPDMRAVKLEDLCSVNIDWKMLTTLRPKTKVEEEIFSRLVQLGKLDLKYQQALQREKSTDWIRKTKNPRSSIVEIRVLSCKECGEDFCDGSLCSKMTYDHFSRAQATSSSEAIKNLKIPETGKGSKKVKKKRKRKSRRRKRSKPRRMKAKNNIFNRPYTKGCNRDHSRRGSQGKAADEIRSSSLNRLQSGRKPIFPGPKRSKSAPRLHFKRSDYHSDSCPTQTDYSSQSDSEGYPNGYGSPGRKRSSTRVGFADDYQSDSSSSAVGRRRRSTRRRSSTGDSDASEDSLNDSTGPSRSRSQSGSPEKSSSRPCSKYPTTIHITFDGSHSSSGVFFPRKSYVPSKFGSVRHPDATTAAMPRNQEVTKITEGFARIDLSFANGNAPTSASGRGQPEKAASPKRISSRFSRSRVKPDVQPLLPSPYVRGQSLLGKFVNRKRPSGIPREQPQ